MIDAGRFSRLADAAADGLKERGEIVAGALLAVLSGQSVFFYGPPGTAKSLIARRLSGCFKSSAFFECLMNRFTTPEEIFGPVSIRELKTEDRYVRKTDGFLPSADFGFLDEIWKSSPAILNTLLTILNERKFRNGDKVEDVPLKAIVAASNEIPQPGQELKRLCDLLGRLMAAEKCKEREEIVTTVEYEVPKIDTSVKEEIAGITLGRSIEDVVPSELATCGDSDLETLFDLKFIEGRLMCFEKSGVLFEKRTKDEAQTVERETVDGRGPMILCIDTSGSMSGNPEVVAKAVSLALVMRARQEKRKCYLIKFSTGIEAQNVGDGASLDAIIGFLSSSFNGGTDADRALKAGIKMMEQNDYRKADLLVVSDFCFGGRRKKISNRIIEQKKSGNRFYAVIVDNGGCGYHEMPPPGFDGVWCFRPGDCSLTALKEPARAIGNG